jgi:two-component system sensor histidine kinase QseC
MRCEKPRWRHSLAARLLAGYLKALAVTLGVLGGAAAILLTWHQDVVDEIILTAQANHIARDLRYDAQGRPSAVGRRAGIGWIYESLAQDIKYSVVDGGGRVVLSSEPMTTALVPPGQPFDPERDVFALQLGDQHFLVATVPVPPSASPERYHVQAALSERASQLARIAIIKPLARAAVWTALSSVVLLSVVLAVAMRRSLVPLREASLAAARIEPRNLGARLSAQHMPAELQTLIDAFNQALERLEKGYRVQQEFLAGAAHELKTPLALIRAQIEMSGPANSSADRSSLLHDVDLMARQVHQLLNLAEVSESQNYVLEPIAIASVASDVTGYLARLADRRQVSLNLVADAAVAPVNADRSALFVLVKNLVENAIQHSPEGGTVTMTIDAAGLRVRDEGAGIADHDMPRLFERFWRGEQRRDEGAGLGLAICREIALTHGWQLIAGNASPGAEFRLCFTAGS